MLYSQQVKSLLKTQLNDWDLARVNYAQLKKVRTRKFDFNGFEILVQFNQERIRSSAAKVDAKSIEARPCFLCAENRPQQMGVTFSDNLTILVNPFPIFPDHLTIPSDLHTDQRIQPNFSLMLHLAKALPDYVIFYNGPQCGASAPDHFHFQAGNRGFLPVEADWTSGKFTRLISEHKGTRLFFWEGYKRGIITLEGSAAGKLTDLFNQFYQKMKEIQPDRPEPMLNILAYYYNKSWVIHIIPRKLHRPVQYFLEGSQQILLSPASVDLGGVIITPREEDFDKITSADIEDIFTQVCFDEHELAGLLTNEIKKKQ
jgi:hypothetical protein